MFKKFGVILLALSMITASMGTVFAADGSSGGILNPPAQNQQNTDLGTNVVEGTTDKENEAGQENKSKAFEQTPDRLGITGLQNALSRVKANGSPVAQMVLQRLIEAGGDVPSIAQTLKEIAAEEIKELDEETQEQMKATAEQVREQLAKDQELTNEQKKENLSGIARFFENAGAKDKALGTLEDIVQFIPRDLETFQKIAELYTQQGVQGIKTYVNGKKPEFDVQPKIENGRTLVPFRALGEALDAVIGWDSQTKTVSFKKGDITVKLTIGQKTALVNGQAYVLDVPAAIDNGRTIVPLRFISEALKAQVDYIAESKMVIVTE